MVQSPDMKVLGIETSCDETGIAVIEGDGVIPFTIMSNAIYSQIAIHRKFGGVYPEAASREHVRKIGIVLEEAIEKAAQLSGIPNDKAQIPNQIQNSNSRNHRTWIQENIDAIAVTAGPGLIGSLLVGVNAAKSLAYAYSKPIIGVNHHEGHIAAAFLESSDNQQLPELPALALVVSGGHTMLVLMRGIGDYQILGRTRDDAAGEAFDKTARLIGLPYPGGPEIAKLAELHKSPKHEIRNPKQAQNSKFKDLKLPRPMIDSGDLSFSFSGLKTAVSRWIDLHKPLDDDKKALLAYEIQEAIVDVLVLKTQAAVQIHKPASLIVSGGVAANRRLGSRIRDQITHLPVHIPPPSLCTDNGAMIGAAGLLRVLAGQVQNWYDVVADDSLTLPLASE